MTARYIDMKQIPHHSLFLMLILMAFETLAASAQNEVPTISPTAVYTDIKGEQEESENEDRQADRDTFRAASAGENYSS
jgi:hypothetical protein